MSIDIFNIAPNVVSRDLRGKIVTFYGSYKSGKTYNASKFNKPLLVAFEKGYSAISGIRAANINKWTDFKRVLKQLRDPRAHEMYETIIIDTVDVAYEMCENYIATKHEIEYVDELGYGKGHKRARKEFFEALNEIPSLGFGLVMISHSFNQTIKPKNGEPYVKIVSSLSDKVKDIVFGMSDILGYARTVQDHSGKNVIRLYMRETEEFEAGSRWKYIPDSIEFTYENLVNALADAIEKQEQEEGAVVTNEYTSMYQPEEKIDFEELMAQVVEVCGKITDKGDYGSKITKIVESHLGKGKKVSQATEDQVDIVALILDDLKDLLNSLE
jgi:AAA domain